MPNKYFAVKHLTIILAFFALPLHMFAQDISADTIKTKKPWYLNFTTDVKTKSVYGWYNKTYTGERSQTGQPTDPQWTWITDKENIKNLLANSRFIDVKMDVLLSRNRIWNFGLSYNFGYLEYKNYTKNSSGQNIVETKDLSFIAITGLGEYRYFIKKKDEFTPFVFGSLAGGFYRGVPANSGAGTEWFGEGRLGAGYLLKHGWMGRLWVAQNMLFYNSKTYSPVFKKDQTVNIQQGMSYWGIGFSKEFTLIPD